MSNLQLIEALCALAEEQSRIMEAMGNRLGELGDDTMAAEATEAGERYRKILGADEAPDFLCTD